MEKLVAKMQKKNAVLNEGDDEEEAPTSLGESGGAKEPNHSEEILLVQGIIAYCQPSLSQAEPPVPKR